MGNSHWGLGIRFVFICIVLVTKCVGGENLTTASCSEQERLALIKFKQSVKDENGMLSSWRVGSDCCRWERVGCDEWGRVVSLHLRRKSNEESYLDDRVGLLEYNLYGLDEDYYLDGNKVNSCLSELVNLEHLDLSGNDFQQSRLPEFIGSFRQLRYLNLSHAGFSGNIPHQIGNLSNLKVLDLSSSSLHSSPYSSLMGTQFMTNDMAWISGLSKLEHLDLSGVYLNRVRNLDHLLYTIPSLVKLSLSGCVLSMSHLVSNHRNSSRELASIKHLDLSDNNFGHHIPSLIFNMTSLEFVDLSYNDISMALIFENFINMIPSVLELRMSWCGLQRHNLAPTSLNSSTNYNIQHLDLSWNEIEGRFPSILANMSSVLSVDLSHNRLNSSVGVMPNLLKLDISGNNFRQIEDVGIWRQCHLKELIGSKNNLEGEMISPSTNVSKCSQNALEILDLGQNKISNSIPETIGKWTNLRALDLSYNALTGPIPKSVGNLRSLQVLYLSYNQLSGPIPPKFHKQLTTICLASNQLSGSIPESLGRLNALTDLLLQSNQFTGPVPAALGGLASLRVFSVASNLLNGTIPNSIGQLTKLHLLDVSNNFLQGVVSEDHFAKLSMLKFLNANYNNKLLFNISSEWIPPFQLYVARLCSCKIEDGFPQWFRTQRKLEELVLSNSSIYGPLPTWLRLLPIGFLDLSHNKLTGPLTNLIFEYPPRFGLRFVLLLQNNIFTGSIPSLLCLIFPKRPNNVLDLSKNRLTGKVPKCLWNIPMNVLILGSNRLSGVLPSSLGTNSSLEWLHLSDNNFNGELPRDFVCSTWLAVLDLGGNKFFGNIPECIGENSPSLAALRLHKNNFTGRIPPSLCEAQALQILDLAHNILEGSIPRCLGELDGMKGEPVVGFAMDEGDIMQVLKGVELQYTGTVQFLRNMDFSSNKLVGEIPEEVTTLDGLVGLNLSHNHFNASIPKNIGKMKSLNSLDLSANELSGTIPPSIAALNFLSYLDLSNNNLSGQIPTGNQLQTLNDPSMYANNTYLCGAPLPKECFPHAQPPTQKSKKKYKNASEPNKVWFYLDITCGFATGFWGIIAVLAFKKQWRQKLFMFCEVAIDKIYVAVAIQAIKMKRGCK